MAPLWGVEFGCAIASCLGHDLDRRPLHRKASLIRLCIAKRLPQPGAIMRLPRFRVRTLLLLVAAVALLIWGSMMGVRSFAYYRLAREYGANERGWRAMADRPNQPGGREFCLQC